MLHRHGHMAAGALGAWLLAMPAALAGDAAATLACPHNPAAMGTARTIEVATTGGGDIGTLQYATTLQLAPKELVLTFDDGPNPEHTPKILDALDAHCIKATFFVVGRYAELHPDIVAETFRRGHTIATHTWSHPNLARMTRRAAERQIARGMEAARAALAGITDAAGEPARVAPFFRFPGLNHTAHLRGWLAGQDIATLSCDIGTDDWRPISPWRLKQRALSMIEARGSGLVIFHDTQARTSSMLPQILDELARRGYRAVHMVPGTGTGSSASTAIARARAPTRPVPATPRTAPYRAEPQAHETLWADRLATARKADALTARALADARAAARAGSGEGSAPALRQTLPR